MPFLQLKTKKERRTRLRYYLLDDNKMTENNNNNNNKCSDVKVVNYPARRTMKRTLPAASVIIIIMNQRLQGPCAASSMICSLAAGSCLVSCYLNLKGYKAFK